MAYALNRNDWDLLVCYDTDALFNVINFNKIIYEFVDKSEILLTTSYMDCIGGPFMIYKKKAAIKYLHQRPYPNIVDDGDPNMLHHEVEMTTIYKKSEIWNPWPEIANCCDSYNFEKWEEYPIIRKPPENLVYKIIERCSLYSIPLT